MKSLVHARCLFILCFGRGKQPPAISPGYGREKCSGVTPSLPLPLPLPETERLRRESKAVCVSREIWSATRLTKDVKAARGTASLPCLARDITGASPRFIGGRARRRRIWVIAEDAFLGQGAGARARLASRRGQFEGLWRDLQGSARPS